MQLIVTWSIEYIGNGNNSLYKADRSLSVTRKRLHLGQCVESIGIIR